MNHTLHSFRISRKVGGGKYVCSVQFAILAFVHSTHWYWTLLAGLHVSSAGKTMTEAEVQLEKEADKLFQTLGLQIGSESLDFFHKGGGLQSEDWKNGLKRRTSAGNSVASSRIPTARTNSMGTVLAPAMDSRRKHSGAPSPLKKTPTAGDLVSTAYSDARRIAERDRGSPAKPNARGMGGDGSPLKKSESSTRRNGEHGGSSTSVVSAAAAKRSAAAPVNGVTKTSRSLSVPSNANGAGSFAVPPSLSNGYHEHQPQTTRSTAPSSSINNRTRNGALSPPLETSSGLRRPHPINIHNSTHTQHQQLFQPATSAHSQVIAGEKITVLSHPKTSFRRSRSAVASMGWPAAESSSVMLRRVSSSKLTSPGLTSPGVRSLTVTPTSSPRTADPVDSPPPPLPPPPLAPQSPSSQWQSQSQLQQQQQQPPAAPTASRDRSPASPQREQAPPPAQAPLGSGGGQERTGGAAATVSMQRVGASGAYRQSGRGTSNGHVSAAAGGRSSFGTASSAADKEKRNVQQRAITHERNAATNLSDSFLTLSSDETNASRQLPARGVVAAETWPKREQAKSAWGAPRNREPQPTRGSSSSVMMERNAVEEKSPETKTEAIETQQVTLDMRALSPAERKMKMSAKQQQNSNSNPSGRQSLSESKGITGAPAISPSFPSGAGTPDTQTKASEDKDFGKEKRGRGGGRGGRGGVCKHTHKMKGYSLSKS